MTTQKKPNWFLKHPCRGAAAIVTVAQLVGLVLLLIVPSRGGLGEAITAILFCTDYLTVEIYRRTTGNLFFENAVVMWLGILTNWMVYTIVVAIFLSVCSRIRKSRTT